MKLRKPGDVCCGECSPGVIQRDEEIIAWAEDEALSDRAHGRIAYAECLDNLIRALREANDDRK